MPIRIGQLDTGVGITEAKALSAFRMFDADGHPLCSEPVDSTGHGTRMVRLMRSVVPTASFYAAAVIDDGHIYSRILAGLEWMMTQPVKVVSMAIGVPARTPLFEPMLARLYRRDILVVVPSGNAGSGVVHTPAWSPHVLTVGAAEQTGEPAPYSSSVNEPDGTCLKPEILAVGEHDDKSGTSFASSLVAALAARYRAEFPGRSVDEVIADFIRSTVPVHDSHRHKVRYGTLDIARLSRNASED
jgi:subtilisin family serine protease